MPDPRAGLLFLGDLNAFAPWISDRGRTWIEARGGEATVLPPTVMPPAGLVLVLPAIQTQELTKNLPWLRLIRRLALVIEAEPELDHDLRDVAEAELAEVRLALGNVVAVFEVSGDTTRTIEAALEVVAGSDTWPNWTPHPTRPAAAPGPWIPWSAPHWRVDQPADLDGTVRHVAAGLCAPDGRPALFDATHGDRIDLTTGARTPLPTLRGAADALRPVAALPDGVRWLTSAGAEGWKVAGASPSPAVAGGWGVPIGVDPGGLVAWGGGRCWFHWRVMLPAGPLYWTPSSHGWPDGHGKKLYGYKDNDPLFVHLAPDASACLSVYEHDVLLTPGLPLRWRDVDGIAVAERHQEAPRALFFERSDGDGGFPADPASGDEDARDQRAVVCLGPSAGRRYTVGLDAVSWRLVGDTGTRLGGPGEGWRVYDDRHAPVRSGEGRLLAGWHRWIVVLRDDQLLRIDLVTDAEEPLGAAGRPITAAVAVPGSPNVVLLQEGLAALRIV